jgi:hypothetical protein
VALPRVPSASGVSVCKVRPSLKLLLRGDWRALTGSVSCPVLGAGGGGLGGGVTAAAAAQGFVGDYGRRYSIMCVQ